MHPWEQRKLCHSHTVSPQTMFILLDLQKCSLSNTKVTFPCRKPEKRDKWLWLRLKASVEISINSLGEVIFQCTLPNNALLNPHPRDCIITLKTGCWTAGRNFQRRWDVNKRQMLIWHAINKRGISSELDWQLIHLRKIFPSFLCEWSSLFCALFPSPAVTNI